MQDIAGQLSKVLEPGDQRHCKAKIFTSRHIGRPRGPTGEDGRAILENAGKGKVGLNRNPSCPKGNRSTEKAWMVAHQNGLGRISGTMSVKAP